MINRNNYEEYLLLYIDGELSPEEKQSVGAFLDQNPDLKEELDLLQQAVLQPEAGISFSGKDALYRKEEGITHANYQEYFLLYVDEELDIKGKEAVETFVLKNPGLQDEFTILKQAVLPKEHIVFDNKESLYRKEEKRRPVVIGIRWASLAAAAFIGAIALVGLWKTDDRVAPGSGPTAVTPAKKDNPQDGGVTPSTQPDRQLPVSLTAKRDNNTVVDPARQKQVTAPAQFPVAVTTQPQQSIAQQQTIIPDPVIAAGTNTNQGNTGASNTYSGSSDENKTVSTGTNTENVAATNTFVQPAVAAEEELDPEEDSKSVYVGAVQINPDKVRGFLRKAGRFLTSKVKNKDEDGDGKIQVANLEINKLK